MNVLAKNIKSFIRFSALSLAALCLLATLGMAAELSDELAQKVSTASPNQTFKVWIKLPQVESAANLKADARYLTTRAERYRVTRERLVSSHKTAQKDLLSHLEKIVGPKGTNASSPKGHWLVNIIEAELTAEQLARLTGRDDIETIYSVPKLVTIVPETATPSSTLAPVVESNIEYINAPAAWAAGYTGEGSIICIFDTGVDGLHPAIFNNWKGHDGDSAAAWFDPREGESFPHILPVVGGALPYHGTATTGISLGHDDATGDTVGVALDAKWIAAGVVDVEGAAIIDAFEWAADPDGDPNSLDDVPDVINHSWGVPNVGCENIFYTIIDNVEALGIINIFAAGNEGTQGSFTIRNPGNRGRTNVDCFAVGNIDHTTGIIAPSSSRGPSDCNPGTHKPNVVAPGTAIRVPSTGTSYAGHSGTSFAAPHVSGLVALLRGKNPNATVDEIKYAILNATTRVGALNLPNDIYGWGLINCMAALNALPGTNTQPNVRVYSFEHDPAGPGDEVIGRLVLKNLGATVTGVSAALQDNNEALTVNAGVAAFGTIAASDTVRADVDFRVVVSDTVTAGSILPIDLAITGDGYSNTVKLYFVVQPTGARTFVTHNTATIEFSVSNFGTLGLADNSYFPAGGRGFRHLGSDNFIWDGGLMIGVAPNRVSDGATTALGEPDGDFAVAPGGNITFVTPMAGVSQQTFARFTDQRAESPMGLTVEQHSYAFDYAPFGDFVILQYVIRNDGPSALNSLYVGLHNDWDVVSATANVGGYESSGEFVWTAYSGGTQIMPYRGVRVLHRQLVTAYTENVATISSCPDSCYINAAKYSVLSRGISSPTAFRSGFHDLFQVVAARTNLAPGQVDTVAFAYLASNTFAGIQDAADRAAEAYLDTVLMGIPPGPPPLPSRFVLRQNYPNPFNNGTTIEFNLETFSDYTLSVYNILGRKVREYAGRGGPGEVRVVFGSEGLASGIYLYQLEAGEIRASKKMLLLK